MTTVAKKRWNMEIVRSIAGTSGSNGSEIFCGYKAGQEVFGETPKDSGLTLFAYLWRRFGPPEHGCDDYKSLACWVLTTPMEGAYLSLTPSGSAIEYSVGHLVTHDLGERINKPIESWWKRHERLWIKLHPKAPAYHYWGWNTPKGFPRRPIGDKTLVAELNAALRVSLNDLLRPVYVRDVPMNALGVLDHTKRQRRVAERSRYAGYGCDLDAIEKLIAEDKAR